MLRFIFSFLGGLFTFIMLSLVLAAMGIAALFMVYGADLPDHESLAQYQPKVISRIYSGEGQIIDEFAQERRLFAPIETIPDLVKDAFVSAEDKNFYNHSGYDLRGIAIAIFEAIRSRGQDIRGASTITQQVMKNFLLSSDREAERKIKEIILAARVEQVLGKDKILELYLNEIFLGVNSYGVASAAQSYFNKPLDALAPHEAAMLASLPKAPSDYHPVRRKERLLVRRNYVLEEMYENGYISQDVYEVERLQPLRSVQNGDFESFRSILPPRDYFTDEIRRQLSRDFGQGEFFSGGYTVRATIDSEMQPIAARALQRQLETYDRGLKRWRGTGEKIPADQLENWQDALSDITVARDIELDGQWRVAVVLNVEEQQLRIGVEDWSDGEPEPIVPRMDIRWLIGDFFDNFEVGDVVHVRIASQEDGAERWSLRQVPQVQGGFVAMDVNTGRVLAMQGGFSYQSSVFNRATQAQRQPGSSFKPFVYAAALDSGYTPATIVVDAPIEINTPQGLWRPRNASNRFYGPTPLRTGIEQSRNLMTIRLANEVGMDIIADYAERFGVYDNMRRFLANSLGSEESTLYQMVAAYAMFANGGERVEPTLVDRVQDRFGRTVYRHDQRNCTDCTQLAALPQGQSPTIRSDRERVMDPITAYQLTSMMEGVVDRGTAKRTINLSVPIAGKTGTTNDAKDVWFVGFSSNIAAGCYIGFDQPRSLGDGASGGGMCGPVFAEFMRAAIAKFGAGEFAVPPGGQFVKINRFTGARLADNASGDEVVSEYFRDEDLVSLAAVFGQTFDGGFQMGSDLPLVEEVGGSAEPRSVTTSTGNTAVVGPKAGFGTLSSGGLY